jgi:hypothetical protein
MFISHLFLWFEICHTEEGKQAEGFLKQADGFLKQGAEKDIRAKGGRGDIVGEWSFMICTTN